METMYYIGLDVHKRTISYCVKDGIRGCIGMPFAVNADFTNRVKNAMIGRLNQPIEVRTCAKLP